MENREGKPPIRIVKEHSSGSIDPGDETRYSRKSGGGTNWMPGIAGAVIAIIVSAVLVFMVNPAGKGIQTLSGQLTEVNNRVVALEGSLTQANQRIDNLINSQTGYVTQDSLSGLASQQSVTDLGVQIAGLPTQLGELSAKITVLEGRVTAIETPPVNPSNPTGTVRWTFNEPTLNCVTALCVALVTDVSWEGRIQDEDIYDVRVTITNNDVANDVGLNNQLTLVLVPKADALLDEVSTYLDSDEEPWLEWDSDFVVRERQGVETTKRVEFTSDNWNVIVPKNGGSVSLDLILELYYAD